MPQEPYQVLPEPRLDDLTNVYNPLDEDFTWQIGGIDYTIPRKEKKLLPRHSCRLIAKHLADKILQEEYNVADTNRDTPIRKKVLAELLPDEAKEMGVVISSEEALKSAESEVKRAEGLAQSESDPYHKTQKKKVIPPPIRVSVRQE